MLLEFTMPSMWKRRRRPCCDTFCRSGKQRWRSSAAVKAWIGGAMIAITWDTFPTSNISYTWKLEQ